ncbi:MAG: hypothetical protein CMJ19_10135 [Phycisphaeraceae bacterium]|nr:hypothetical protein [Phycisphaeraceae bacterium]
MQTNTQPAAKHVKQAIRRGLDFLVRHQVTNRASADHGRLPFVYDCQMEKVLNYSTNWTTGVAIEALLAGYRAFSVVGYKDAAQRAVGYLYSLQHLDQRDQRLYGVFHEETPQTPMAHPRDALTAAWSLLDWYELEGDQKALDRSGIYADWFVRVAMEKGYPYWTVRFDDQPWEPTWCGSFHSGSAFFMGRMFELTGDQRYINAMHTILDFYNQHHLLEDGQIRVILDRDTHACLDGHADGRYSNRGWEMMHVYNDDFGAMANMACWKLTGDESYKQAAERFFDRMVACQNEDGGFGPQGQSVPSGVGAILMQMLLARQLGLKRISDDVLDRAASYLMDIQVRDEGTLSDGAFHGFDDDYQLNRRYANLRAGAYAVMALLRYAGYTDRIYWLD